MASTAPENAIRALWAFAPDTIQRVDQAGSLAWAIAKDGQSYYLKQHRFQRDPASLEWELQLSRRLAGLDDLPQVPCPVPTADGALCGVYDDQSWILLHAVAGQAVHIAQWNESLAAKIGRCMARFHARTRALALDQRPGQQAMLADGQPQSLDALGDRVRRTEPVDPDQALLLHNADAIIADLHETQDALRASLGARPLQLVHGDFTPWNLLLDDDGEIAALIDFEFARLDHPLADLSRVAYINAEHVGEEGPYPLQWVLGLVRGYAAEEPLSAAERASIADFMRLHFLTGCLAMMGQWLCDGPQWPHLKDHVKVYAALWPNYLEMRAEADALKRRLVEIALSPKAT